jgi:hypothetical protein
MKKLFYVLASSQIFVVDEADIVHISETDNKIICVKVLTISVTKTGLTSVSIHVNDILNATIFYDVKAEMKEDDPIYKSAYQYLTGVELPKS